MRALALVLLLASPAVAVDPGLLRVPARDNLPGLDPSITVSPAVAKLGGAALLSILKDAKDERRHEAVLALTDRLSQTERGNKAYSWKPVADVAEAIEWSLDLGEPLEFRRWAVYMLFASGSAEVRGRITLDPEDRKTDEWWKRFDGLRRKAGADVDPKLAEFFERYRNDPLAPRWKEAKAAAEAGRDKMLKEHPERREHLEKVWKLQLSIEDSQQAILPRFYKNIEAKSKKSPARIEALKAVDRSVCDHRLRIGWANMIPRIMAESFGDADARSYGFEAAPVTVGWPAIPPR